MKRFLCRTLPTQNRPAMLDSTESHHLLQVLRLRSGETVEAIDGKGHAVLARIQNEGKGMVSLHFEGQSNLIHQQNQVLPLCLEVAILKADAMSWVIEKAVELGVRELIPVLTERTVVRIQKKGPEAFVSRWQKIADQALKQCGRLDAMKVSEPRSLDSILPDSHRAMRILFLETTRDSERPLLEVLNELPMPESDSCWRLLVGPEGGFSDREIEIIHRSDARIASLGPLVLRAETAAILGASVASSLLRSEARNA